MSYLPLFMGDSDAYSMFHSYSPSVYEVSYILCQGVLPERVAEAGVEPAETSL